MPPQNSDTLARIETTLQWQNKTMEETRDDVKRLVHAVYGNGQVGLVTRVAIHEQAIAGLKEDQKERQEDQRQARSFWRRHIGKGIFGIIGSGATVLWHKFGGK